MRKIVYMPLFNLFVNYDKSFYVKDSLGYVTNWDDIFSGSLKSPYNEFRSLFDSYVRNFKAINDILLERVSENRENLGIDPKAFLKLQVDLTTMFLLLRIQMDKIAELTTYFYEDCVITGKKRKSFNKQRNWWLSDGMQVDHDFSEIIERKTQWFDGLIGEIGLRDGLVHKNMNIHIDTSNYETNGAVIKKTKGNISVGQTEEVLDEVAKYIGGFYDFCKEYENFFLKKTKKEYVFEKIEYWYDSVNVEKILARAGYEHVLSPIDYTFMK